MFNYIQEKFMVQCYIHEYSRIILEYSWIIHVQENRV